MRISWSIALLSILFVGAGALHFIIPRPYEQIVPGWLPNAPLVVRVSGIAEILGGLGLLVPSLRIAAGWGLILLLVAVLPANVQMLKLAMHAAETSRLWLVALWVRLPLQAAMIWWVFQSAIRR